MANTSDYNEVPIEKIQVEELTIRLLEILQSKKVDKEKVIRNLETYIPFGRPTVDIFTLLKDEKVTVDKSTIMMIIDVCNDLVGNQTEYVLYRSPILSILPKQFVLESRNLLIYLYQVRIKLMSGEKIEKSSFIKAMSKFSNVSDMIILMVKGIAQNTNIIIISKRIILTCLDIVNESVGIISSFLINSLQ